MNDDTLSRLVAIVAQTNMISIDKMLAAIKRSPTSYAAAAIWCHSLAERMLTAAKEVKQTLPKGGCKCAACVAGQTEDFDYAS